MGKGYCIIFEFLQDLSKLNLKDLEKTLTEFSYINGYIPSSLDSKLYSHLQSQELSNFLHLSRWFRHMQSFAQAERDSFAQVDVLPNKVDIDKRVRIVKKPTQFVYLLELCVIRQLKNGGIDLFKTFEHQKMLGNIFTKKCWFECFFIQEGIQIVHSFMYFVL